eukprot:1067697-Rhodomonas_salina.2
MGMQVLEHLLRDPLSPDKNMDDASTWSQHRDAMSLERHVEQGRCSSHRSLARRHGCKPPE